MPNFIIRPEKMIIDRGQRINFIFLVKKVKRKLAFSILMQSSGVTIYPGG